MKFLADENIPLKVVKRLRDDGLDVTSVMEIRVGMNDEDIAKLSEKEKAIIITFDKDFGEIIFRRSIKPYGLILLRIPPKSVGYIYSFLKWLLIESKIEFEKKLIVVREDKIRILNL